MMNYEVKEYPLEIQYTTEGACYSKGWHPSPVFLREVHNEVLGLDREPRWSTEDVRYDVWRCIPDLEERGMIYFWPAQLGTPGAFPVTVVGGR